MIILSQLLSSLVVSVVASILVLRYSDRLASASKARILLLSLGLLLLAIALTFVPALTLSTLMPSPETRSVMQRAVLRGAIIVGFNIAAISYAAATLIALSPSNARTENLVRYLGPVLGVLGVGALLPFSCARVLAGVLDGVWEEIDNYFVPTSMLLISVYLSIRPPSQQPVIRLALPFIAGILGLSFSFGYEAGYFSGLAELFRA
jgi:hypothetical protein